MSAITDEIKERVDLVELVQRAVPLRKSGSSFKGLCPFHQEKTPSFYVFPASHTWVCFGCGKKGTAFDWLMERDHLEFGEALRVLAQTAGVDLPARRDSAREDATVRLYDLVSRSQSFYQAALLGTGGATARSYLAERGINEASVTRFGLGYAPPGNPLMRYLEEAGFSRDEMIQTGALSVAEDGHHFDFFRDRLLFPIRDSQGRAVAFGGRALGDAHPKYVNSRDTLLFHKQETLFALDLARKPIQRERTAVVVEGYVDALMAHQHGYENVVATLGTAITSGHLRMLRRLAEDIVLALDSDAAGQAATWRALQVADQSLQAGLTPALGPDRRRRQYVAARAAQLRVLSLPSAKDPDELIRSDADAWKRLVAEAPPVADFVLAQVGQRHDLTTARGKAEAADEVVDLLAGMGNPIEQAHYVQEAAQRLRIEQEALWRALRAKRPSFRQPPNSRTQSSGPGGWNSPPEEKSSPPPSGGGWGVGISSLTERGDPLDEYALALLIRVTGDESPAQSDLAERLTRLDFALPESKAAALYLAGSHATAVDDLADEVRGPLAKAQHYLTDVARFAPEKLSEEYSLVALEMRKRALVGRQAQLRTLLRDDEVSDEERLRWAAELSTVARELAAVDEELEQVRGRAAVAASA